MNHRFTFFPSIGLVSMLFLVVSVGANAQSTESGGEYGALTVKVGAIRNSSAVFVGGRGGWILDHHLVAGIGGYILANNVVARVSDTAGNARLSASYGGLDIGYLVPLDSSIFISAQALAGGGAVGHTENRYTNPRPHYDPFVLFEPALNVDIGLTRIFRFSLGASYRFVGRLSSPVATGSDLSGPTFNVSITAGFF